MKRLIVGMSGSSTVIYGIRLLEKLAARLPGEHHLLYTEVDGEFPNHHPDPTVEENLADLRELVAGKSLDFGVAFGPPIDRCAAAAETIRHARTETKVPPSIG
mgnify:CR=1 FL=1